MKKKIALLLLMLVCVLALAACSGFGGGKTDGGGGDPYGEGGDMSGGDLSDTITITFDTDGGSTHAPLVLERFGDNSLRGKLPTPTKKGYKFMGWYEGGTEVTEDRYFGYDCTLTAQWEMVWYTARIHLEDRFADTLDFNEFGYSVNHAGTMPEPDTRYGYRFAGWYTDATYTTRVEAVGDGTPYLCDIDLYGKFELDPFDIKEYCYDDGNGGYDYVYSFCMKNYNDMAAAITAEELASLSTIVIPATYEGNPITKIAYAAFAGWTNITSIVIPEGIEEFEGDLFLSHTGVTSLTLPDSLLVLDSGTRYTILNNGYMQTTEYQGGLYLATATNPYAIFVKPASETPVTSITLHADTKIIGPEAFVIDSEPYYHWVSHEIVSIVLSGNIKSICEDAFRYCDELIAVALGAGVQHVGYGAFDGCTIKMLTAPISALDMIPGESIEELNLTGGTAIGKDALKEFASLKKIALSNTITEIHENAFDGISTLASVQIGTGVTSIAQLSFIDKVSQIDKTTYGGCTYIGNITNPYFILYAANSSMSAVTIHEDTKIIWHDAFANSSALAQPTIPESVVSVGANAFSGAATRGWSGTAYNGGVYVGNTANPHMILTGVASGATEFEIHADAQSFASDIFAGNTSLTKVTLPKGITKVTAELFAGCSALESIYIPDGVTEIGDHAFRDLPNLKSLRLPDTLVKVGRNIVNFNIVHNPNPAVSCSKALYSDGRGGYYLGNESNKYLILFAIYSTSTDLQNSYTVNDKTEIVAPNVLRGRLYEVKLTDSVRIISDYAFGTSVLNQNTYSKELYSVTLGKGVQYIGEYAFADCEKLGSNIVLPDSLTYLGNFAFYACKKISGLTIGTGLAEIGEYAFSFCNSLSSVKIPGNVKKIGNSAFLGCANLKTIRIANGVTEICEDAFGIINYNLSTNAYYTDGNVYCGASSKPQGWHAEWISSNMNVRFGQSV